MNLEIFSITTNKDLKVVKQLFVEYVDSLGFNLDFQNFKEELTDLPGEYAPPKGSLLLAKYQGKTVGCAALREFADGICEMRRLYVKQEFRRLKIGRQLAEAIIQQAREIGYNSMRLDFIGPRIAEQLYKSFGFKEIVPYEDIPIEGAVFMELKL